VGTFQSSGFRGLGGSAPGEQYIVFKQNSRSGNFEGFDLGKSRVGSSDYFRFLVTSASGQSAEIRSATAVATGVWYHVTGVRGTTFTQLYVNGQLERQTNVVFAQDYGSLPLFFGTSGQTSWDHKFNGTLDEVSLYDHALASNEIAAIYAAGAAGKCSSARILAQPQGQSVAAGATASFTVAASGQAPLSYQWLFNSTNIPNGTSTNLTLTNVQVSAAGNYNVVVSNSLGSATSAVAVLNVLAPPAFSSQPASRTNSTGSTAIFTATATGSAPLNYRWQLNGLGLTNGGRISGATSNNLAITNVQTSDAGPYTLVVSNAVGMVTSALASLTVVVPPSITSQPQGQTLRAGTNAALTVLASGTAPLSYQWRSNSANIAGATSASLNLTNVQPANSGNYTVVVTNAFGSVTSAVAVLTVLVPPAIAAQPVSRTNTSGSTATFSATATGSASLSYQWQFNGMNMANGGHINGVLLDTLTITNVQPGDAGGFRLIVSNAVGVATSAVATLTFAVPPAITIQPSNLSVVAGTDVVFTVTASERRHSLTNGGAIALTWPTASIYPGPHPRR